MTADSAAHRIREIDPNCSIGMISQENDPPHARPPLTKGLWKGQTAGEHLASDGGAEGDASFGPTRCKHRSIAQIGDR